MNKKKAVRLRRIALLLIMFGMGLVVGIDISSKFQVLFIIVSMVCFLTYDHVIESDWRKVKTKENNN